MSAIRKALRNQIIQILETQFSQPVRSSRVVDLTDIPEAISVNIDEGETIHEGVQSTTTATLVVGFHSVIKNDDDELDDWSEPAESLLKSANLNITPSGFKYGDDDSGEMNSLFLLFDLIYFS
ncbi:hypothetical protein TDB9533_01233 [Thalassocella blandensis]|nr:hypothetical protein TDB9533_01233 [Thalassocella blandensis]